MSCIRYARKDVDYGEYEKYADVLTPVRYRKNGELWQHTPTGEGKSGEARIMCAGDLMCEPAMSKTAFHNGKWFFEMCFAYVRGVFAKSDFAIANLETTVCTNAPYAIDKHKINGRYHCNAPAEFLDALRYAGLDAVAMANNHTADTGADGLLETLQHVDERGLMHTGAFADSSQRRYILADINGIKVAFFSYTEHINRNIDKEYFTEEGCEIMLNRYSLEKLEKDIADARKNGAEFLICYIHFLSKEYTHEVTKRQEEKASEIAQAGIDCIIGGHSHALQRYDRITTKSGKTVPVIYSLGNFITSDNTSMITRTNMIYELILRKNEHGVLIADEKYIPCRVIESFGRSGFFIFPTPAGWRNGKQSDFLTGVELEIQSVVGNKIEIDYNDERAGDALRLSAAESMAGRPFCLPCDDITLDPSDPKNYKNLRTITLKKICSILDMEVPLQFREMQSDPIRYINAKDKWIVKNSIYFSRFKGQIEIDWAREAYKRGARVLFTSTLVKSASGTPLPCIVVGNPAECFYEVNTWFKSIHHVKTLDITGSVGKTTTKDIVSNVLASSFCTLKSPGNSNTYAGISDTIQRLKPDYEVYVQEVCAFSPGWVDGSSSMLNADACIVTNIGYPHVDLYGSIENILKDKMTIVKNLREGGVAFLNYDDERIVSYPVSRKVISFAIKNKSADYLAENIVNQDGVLSFDVVHGGRRVPVVLNMYGEHNVINALAAFAVGEWFGVPEDRIVKALYDFRSEGIRQSVYDISGYHLYVDCYNSAPNSMIGSIKTLCGMNYGPGSRRIVLFGDIPRLGELAPEVHQRVAEELKDFDVDLYICYGKNAGYAAEVLAKYGRRTICSEEENEFVGLIRENVRLNDVILIKAGHPMKITRALDKAFGTSFHFTDPDVLLEDTAGISKHFPFGTAYNVDGQAEIRSIKEGITTLDIPEKIGGIPVARIGKEAFKGSGLTSVSLPGTLYNIGEGALASCEDLVSISLPASLKIVERDAFNSCVSMKTIVLPQGTAHLGAGAFYNCKALEIVAVPESVQMIEADCFEGCSDILTLLCVPGSFAERYAKEHNIPTGELSIGL